MTSGAEHERLRSLVGLSVDNPLAPFSLRPEKRVVYSTDDRAAVTYREAFGLAVAGGDPVGDPLSWPSAIAEFVALSSANGRGIAVLGAGEAARELWRPYGLSGLAIGRDVVVRPESFDLLGRRFRNLRQAIKRTHNAAVQVTHWHEAEVPPSVRAELRDLMRTGERSDERGFSMILGRTFDGSQPDALIMVARTRGGDLAGAHRYLRAGPKDLSLDLPFRAPGAPNGVDERLIAETVDWAAAHGVARVSLAFAPFPDLFANRHRLGPLGRIGYLAAHMFDPLIRVERLYRYLRKFHAFDQQRFVMLRWRQVARVAVALMWLEFHG